MQKPIDERFAAITVSDHGSGEHVLRRCRTGQHASQSACNSVNNSACQSEHGFDGYYHRISTLIGASWLG